MVWPPCCPHFVSRSLTQSVSVTKLCVSSSDVTPSTNRRREARLTADLRISSSVKNALRRSNCSRRKTDGGGVGGEGQGEGGGSSLTAKLSMGASACETIEYCIARAP